MELTAQRQHDPRRERRRRNRRNVPGQVTLQSQKDARKEKMLYYAAQFLRVALWLAIAWALSYLHMGAPCFLLAVLMWVYQGPLQALFSRARRYCPFSREPKKDN